MLKAFTRRQDTHGQLSTLPSTDETEDWSDLDIPEPNQNFRRQDKSFPEKVNSLAAFADDSDTLSDGLDWEDSPKDKLKNTHNNLIWGPDQPCGPTPPETPRSATVSQRLSVGLDQLLVPVTAASTTGRTMRRVTSPLITPKPLLTPGSLKRNISPRTTPSVSTCTGLRPSTGLVVTDFRERSATSSGIISPVASPRHQPILTKDPSPVGIRLRGDRPRGGRQRPLLIRLAPTHKIAKAIGDMVYDSERQVWVGNRQSIHQFPKDTHSTTMTQPTKKPLLGLGKPLHRSSEPRKVQRIVSYDKNIPPSLTPSTQTDMVFDPVAMRWQNTNQDDDGDDPFAGIQDLADDVAQEKAPSASSGDPILRVSQSDLFPGPSLPETAKPTANKVDSPTIGNDPSVAKPQAPLARLSSRLQNLLRSSKSTPSIRPSSNPRSSGGPSTLGNGVGTEFDLSQDQQTAFRLAEQRHRQLLAHWIPDRRARSGSILRRDYLPSTSLQRSPEHLYDIWNLVRETH
ncbi:hypothetical protein IWQ62_005646 [Dispira parvispora]|uniref:Uncharacterized protein n=1 Tax=Dispira parvispora TaxID=1520584 RepID=A0A9W8AJK9_9FUNG|nr:hypothetical protein IWQ62_005646 [Dispira parvispora]